ncbi:MAG: tripartite tricarboxylate transporter TctB family protein [Deltaproteobacteria bacterium]|nr:tripartite tricarboxylate transporter TctB family protein [Deltaproteobacteria bacterium]
MQKTQSQHDRIAAIFFLIVGVFFAVYARTVDVGTWSEPGPGFLPFWAGIVMAIMAAALMVGSFRLKGSVMPSFFPESASWGRAVSTFACLVAYAFSLQYLGFTLTTFLFVAFLVRSIFPQTWIRALVVAVVSPVGTRLLFVDLLKTQLPMGFVGF